MKVTATVFGVNDKVSAPAVPAEMFRQNDAITRTIAVLMRTYSLAQMALEVLPTGPMPVVNPLFKTLDDEHLPKELAMRRPEIIRSLLRPMLGIYGLQSVTIELSGDELTELRAYWQYLQDGKTEDLDKVQFSKVPLRVDIDPVVAVRDGVVIGVRDHNKLTRKELARMSGIMPDQAAMLAEELDLAAGGAAKYNPIAAQLEPERE